MSTTIVVISDTHCRRWDDVHPALREAVASADVAVHCGDFVHPAVAEGMRRAARRAVLVHGNSDPPDVRASLPASQVVDLYGVRIGVTHPVWGGAPFDLHELFQDFPAYTTHDGNARTPGLDAILFGHLHEPVNARRDGLLFLNPGQGYASFMVPATMAVLMIDAGRLHGEIVQVEPAG